MKLKKIFISITFIICIVVILGWIFMPRNITKIRQDLLTKCSSPINCDCFANIINYRFNDNDADVFFKFMNALARRPDANILEFTDEQSATRILNTVSICRPKQEPKNKQKK